MQNIYAVPIRTSFNKSRLDCMKADESNDSKSVILIGVELFRLPDARCKVSQHSGLTYNIDIKHLRRYNETPDS